MAKISEFQIATELNNDDLFPIVQNSENKTVTLSQLKVAIPSVSQGAFTSERIFRYLPEKNADNKSSFPSQCFTNTKSSFLMCGRINSDNTAQKIVEFSLDGAYIREKEFTELGHGNGIGYDAENGLIYVAPGGNKIVELDYTDLSIKNTITVSQTISSLDYSDGKLYVYGAYKIGTVDITTGDYVKIIDLDFTSNLGISIVPQDMAVNGNYAYLALNQHNQFVVINLKEQKIEGYINAGTGNDLFPYGEIESVTFLNGQMYMLGDVWFAEAVSADAGYAQVFKTNFGGSICVHSYDMQGVGDRKTVYVGSATSGEELTNVNPTGDENNPFTRIGEACAFLMYMYNRRPDIIWTLEVRNPLHDYSNDFLYLSGITCYIRGRVSLNLPTVELINGTYKLRQIYANRMLVRYSVVSGYASTIADGDVKFSVFLPSDNFVVNNLVLEGSTFIPSSGTTNYTNTTTQIIKPKGDKGASAYEVAVENGFSGSEDEWLNSLVGPAGEQGPAGESASSDQIASSVGAWLSEHITNPTNPPIDTSLSVTGAAADASTSGELMMELLSYNCANLLLNADPSSGTHQGITYTLNPDRSWSIQGTATAASRRTLYLNTNSLPDWIIPGKTYSVKYSATNVRFRIIPYYNGTLGSSICDLTSDGEVTMPTDMTGVDIRLFVGNGTTVDETVKPILLGTLTNAEITEKCETLSQQIDSNAKLILDYGSYDALRYATPTGRTHGGITYTYNDGTWTFDGTSTGTSFVRVDGSETQIPDWLSVLSGRRVYIEYEPNAAMYFRLMVWTGSTSETLLNVRKSTVFDIPDLSQYDGAQIRLQCVAGKTFNNISVTPRIYTAVPNGVLSERFNYIYNEPLLTIIDDDGDIHFKYDLLPLIQELNIPIASAATTTRIEDSETGINTRWMTWAQLQECAAGGAEILCHMYSHPDASQVESMTKDEIIHRLIKARNNMRIHGLDNGILVYSHSSGDSSVKLREAAETVFDCGFSNGGSQIPVYSNADRYNLPRFSIDIINNYDITAMKSILDDLSVTGGWAVWMIHTSSGTTTTGYWRAIIDENGEMTGAMDSDGTGNYIGKVRAVPALREAIQYAKQLGIGVVTAEYGLKKYFKETNNFH